MSLVDQIDTLTEAGAKWRLPTKAEIVNEWETEIALRMLFDDFGSSMISKGVYDSSNQKALFLRIWKKVSKVETFTKPPKGIDFHKADTLDELAKRIEHMRKDVPSLADAMQSGAPLPYPVLVKRGSEYEMLGGRTRFGIANILGFPVKALVFDTDKIGPEVLSFVRKSFIEAPVKEFYEEMDRDQREALWKWVEKGRRGEVPVDISPPEATLHKKGFFNYLVLTVADRIEDTIEKYS